MRLQLCSWSSTLSSVLHALSKESIMATPINIRALLRTTCHVGRRRQGTLQRYAAHRRAIASYTSPQQAAQLSIIPSNVDTNSQAFRDNASAMDELTARMAELHATVAHGGPEKARKKHVERNKMLVRDRVTALIDPGSSFLELSALAAHNVYDEDIPAAGIVTGIGTIEGVQCMIVANDSTYVNPRATHPRPC